MGKKAVIVEGSDGWCIFDAKNGETLKGVIDDKEECFNIANKEGYELPAVNAKGSFFSDLEGRPLYVTYPSKSGGLELEYADESPCLDFEICAVCGGPAFGRDSPSKMRNCYYCPLCGKDVDCVPPAELIGELD